MSTLTSGAATAADTTTNGSSHAIIDELEAAPISIDTVEYDFEDYAVTHGIPETRDPLPYRKTGSVFASENENYGNNDGGDGDDNDGAIITSAKHDPRLRTVVCRHWLRDLCMKGSACEFLHKYDLSRMPLCRHGDRCKLKDCVFRHISESNRSECVFYTQGFCIHGPFCRYKHVRRPREDMPVVADFSLGLTQMQAHQNTGGPGGGDDDDQQGQDQRRPAKPNEFYKISLCKHFMAGNCPFGEGCHFAHGEDELREFPKQHHQKDEEAEAPETPAMATADFFQGGASGGGKPCPIIEPARAYYCIVLASSQRDLAISTVRGEWYVQRKHAELLNRRYGDGTAQVMLFFTVSRSRHIQGAALMTSKAIYQKTADQGPGKKQEESFCFRMNIEWYRTIELPVDLAVDAVPDLVLPTSTSQYWEEMTSRTGELLSKVVWNSPLVTLYEAWQDYDLDDGGEKGPPAPEQLLTDFRAPEQDEIAWPTMPGPGFIFGCTSDTMDECLGRGVFGLPAHMKAAASSIQPGATIFLFNVTDRLLFGIFEALTPAIMDIVPTFCSRNPNAKSSPFPVQIRVRVSLECPPLEDTDPILNDILRQRGKGRIGPITHAQTEAVASMLASQCGALQYMVEYQQGIQEGANVRPPPIALPPRTIEAKKEQQQ